VRLLVVAARRDVDRLLFLLLLFLLLLLLLVMLLLFLLLLLLVMLLLVLLLPLLLLDDVPLLVDGQLPAQLLDGIVPLREATSACE
jgi:hypothetical protein